MKFICCLFMVLVTSCSKETSVANPVHEAASTHGHSAPYGGVLHELEGHKASLELLVDEGSLKLFIHDGCAEKSIRIQQEKIAVLLKSATGEQEVFLEPVVSELSGDKVGSASCFRNSDSNIKFKSVELLIVKSIEIQGIVYKNIETKVSQK